MSSHADRTRIRAQQLDRLRQHFGRRIADNPFYSAKFTAAGFEPARMLTRPFTWDDYRRLPFTTKVEFAKDQADHPPYGTNHTAPLGHYTRLHQTSGTSSGRPLRWLDTRESWEWVVESWRHGLSEAVGLTVSDRVFFPFSFGPFLGFWAAFEAVTAAGVLALPGGGMPTITRLKYLIEHRATVVCCTPNYALHLAETAATEGIDLARSEVRAVIVAGEPGGSIPSTRERIETAWGARVYDHYGLSEVGPVAFERTEQPRQLWVMDSAFLVEVLSPDSDQETVSGEIGELVVTTLGRTDAPVIRYRTGDLVRPVVDARGLLLLDGGVIGRADDMIHVRGNNLYPSAIEAVVRRFPEVQEFRIVVDQTGPLADLRIEIEPTTATDGTRIAEAVARAVRDDLLFRAAVVAVPPNTLPRFEMKARRLVRQTRPSA